MSFELHEWDGVDDSQCIVSGKWRTTSEQLAANLPLVQSVMWLRVSFDDSLLPGDMIVSPATWSYLRHKLGLSMATGVTFTPLSSAMTATLVLRPQHMKKTTNLDPRVWDQYKLGSTAEKALKMNIKFLMNSFIVAKGCTVIVVRFLDTILTFQVEISSISCESNVDEADIPFSVNISTSIIDVVSGDGSEGVIDQTQSNLRESGSSPTVSCSPADHYHYLTLPFSRGVAAIDTLLSIGSSSSSNNHSILFQGPQGSGKSFLLLSLKSYAQQHKLRLREQCEIIYLDGFEQHMYSGRGNQALMRPKPTREEILGELRKLSRTSTVEKKGDGTEKRGAVIIIVDHLDEIFKLFSEDSHQAIAGVASADGADLRQLSQFYLAFLLHHLLLDLSIGSSTSSKIDEDVDNNNQQRVLVMGATRIPRNALPRAHTGCPEFEIAIPLEKPSTADRDQLLQTMLMHYGKLISLSKSGEMHPIADPISDNELLLLPFDQQHHDNEQVSLVEQQVCMRRKWSKELAEATRGYLPGDLLRIIQHAVNSNSSLQTSNSEKSNSRTEITWMSLLKALAETPPRAVLDFQLEFSSELQANGGLCWKNMVGYDEVKEEGQRIVRVLSQGRSKNAGRSSELQEGSGHQSNALWQALASKASRGMVVHGPSGCGKSFLVQVMAKEVRFQDI